MEQFLFELFVFTVLCFFIEAFFTGIADFIRSYFKGEKPDWHLHARTQLWGIFVFGTSAAVSYPLLDHIAPEFFVLHWAIRGAVYVIGIYAWEYFWGLVLEKLIGFCPWEYTKSQYAIWRYTSPWFCAFWFGLGFALEWIHLELIPVLAVAFL